ncbi:hypothetical protein D9M69_675970 [compost metagenome]
MQLRREFVFDHQLLPGVRQCGASRLGGPGQEIEKQNLTAGLDGHLRDAAPHGTRAHDADGWKNWLHMKVLF